MSIVNEHKLAEEFTKLYVGTDCQTTFKLHDVVVLIRDCFNFECKDDMDKSEMIMEFFNKLPPTKLNKSDAI